MKRIEVIYWVLLMLASVWLGWRLWENINEFMSHRAVVESRAMEADPDDAMISQIYVSAIVIQSIGLAVYAGAAVCRLSVLFRRSLTIQVLHGLLLLDLPVGTIFGVYGLWSTRRQLVHEGEEGE